FAPASGRHVIFQIYRPVTKVDAMKAQMGSTRQRYPLTACLVVLSAFIRLSTAFSAEGTPEPVRFVSTAEATRVHVVAALPEALLSQIPEGKLSAQQGEKILVVTSVEQGGKKTVVPILGNYERKNGQLIFTPRFALAHGQTYCATFNV